MENGGRKTILRHLLFNRDCSAKRNARPHTQEREIIRRALGRADALSCSALFSANDQKAAIAVETKDFSSDTKNCSRSLGERIRVRASNHLTGRLYG